MGKKNKRQETKEVSSVGETEEEEEVKASSTGRGVDDEGGESAPVIAPRKRGRPRKIAAEKEGEMGGVGKKKKKEEKTHEQNEQQVKEEEDSTRSRVRRKSTPRKSS